MTYVPAIRFIDRAFSLETAVPPEGVWVHEINAHGFLVGAGVGASVGLAVGLDVDVGVLDGLVVGTGLLKPHTPPSSAN